MTLASLSRSSCRNCVTMSSDVGTDFSSLRPCCTDVFAHSIGRMRFTQHTSHPQCGLLWCWSSLAQGTAAHQSVTITSSVKVPFRNIVVLYFCPSLRCLSKTTRLALGGQPWTTARAGEILPEALFPLLLRDSQRLRAQLQLGTELLCQFSPGKSATKR